jgi:hypothetical protein
MISPVTWATADAAKNIKIKTKKFFICQLFDIKDSPAEIEFKLIMVESGLIKVNDIKIIANSAYF